MKYIKMHIKPLATAMAARLRILALLAVLALVAVIAVFALDGYEVGESFDGHGYISYGPGYLHTYEAGGYAGDAPASFGPVGGASINISIDNDGNVSTDQPGVTPGVVLDGDYLHMQLPASFYGGIGISMPYGWTHQVNNIADEYGRIIGINISVNHTWNDNSFIGIMPASVTGLPGGWTQANLPPNATIAQWNAALNPPGFGPVHVISVTGDQDTMPTVVISDGRNIIVTSSGTNINNSPTDHLRDPALDRYILWAAPEGASPQPAGHAYTGRHFVVRDGSTLTLSHIILDGGVTSTTLTGFNRGGVHVGGVPTSTPQVPRFGGARLVLTRGATVARNAWSNNAAIVGTFAGTYYGTFTGVGNVGGGVGAGIEAAGGMAAGYDHGGARVYMHYDSEVVDNISTVGWGGGIHIRQGGHLVMYNGLIGRNRTFRTASPGVNASSNGTAAGVHVGANETFESTFVMHNGAIRGNTAYATRSGVNGIFRAGGAGVFIHQFCTFTMNGGVIEGNVLSGNRTEGSTGEFILNGAGVLLLGRFVAGTAQSNASQFIMNGGYIRDNTVSMAAVGVHGVLGGGGVGLYGGLFTMNGGYIEYNTADEGGGVYINTGGGGGTVVMTNGQIRYNRANYGAGVGINPQVAMSQGIWGPTSFTMVNGTIRNNTYCPDGDIPQGGGGVFVHGGVAHVETGHPRRDPGTFTMTGGVIENNQAVRGGGIYLGGGMDGPYDNFYGGHGAEFVLEIASTVRNNTAEYGGGIYGASSAKTGGGIDVGGAASLTMRTGGLIELNRAYYGGGVNMNNSVFDMEGGVIRDNRMQPHPSVTDIIQGGGVRMTGSNAVFTMTGGTIGAPTANPSSVSSNRALYGGGVAIVDGASFIMQTGAGNSSGTITGNATPSTSISAGQLSSSAQGGGVYLAGANSSFDMYAGVISSNYSRAGGGVIVYGFSADDYVTFTMHGGTISANRGDGWAIGSTAGVASGGGVLAAGYYARFYMYNGLITRNTAQSWSGAGVTVMGDARFIMYDGHIYDNDAALTGLGPDSGGGGVAARHNGVFTMKGGIIENNNGIIGGGVLAYNQGLFIFEDGLITNNRIRQISGAPALGGGGIAAIAFARIEMHGGTVSNHNLNLVNQAGGGAWVGEMLHPPDAHLPGPSHFLMTGGRIVDNEADNGGGVHVRGGHEHCPVCGGRLHIVGDCTCEDGANGVISIGPESGWLYSLICTEFIESANAYSIIAPLSGIAHGTFAMTGGDIYNNEARANGGGVHVIEDGIFTMSGGIIGHTATGLGNTAVSGGGVSAAGGALFEMLPGVTGDVLTYGRIMRNEATGVASVTGGGGVHVSGLGTEFTMQAGIIGGDSRNQEGNTAPRGGGVHVHEHATFKMEAGSIIIDGVQRATQGYIRGNHATGITADHGGGGVFLFRVFNAADTRLTSFILDAGVVGGNAEDGEGNLAQHGGGVFLHSSATLNMSGGYISGNRARACGGGINIGANPTINTVNMSGGTIGGYYNGEGNIAGTDGGGVRIGSTSTFNMDDGRIIGNNATHAAGVGGGVAVMNNAVFNMRGGTIGHASYDSWGNHAARGGGVSITNGGQTTIPAIFNMYSGTIGRNTARDSGGGVFVNDLVINHEFNLRGGTQKIITGNSATNDGGGVFVGWNRTTHAGGRMRMQESYAASNVHITNNTAGRMGGGIYTGNFEYYNDPLTLVHGTASNPGNAPNAYSNLTLLGVTFGGNSANRRFWPPSNATDVIPATAFVAASTSQPEIIPNERRHPLNNNDINFRVDLQQFDFFKTNGQVYTAPPFITLLPGAQFRLFRNIDPGVPIGTGAAGLVTHPGGVLDSRWEEVIFTGGDLLTLGGLAAESTGSNVPISFVMDPRHHYQLVEVMAPASFQIPFGQWRVNYDTTAAVGTNPFSVSIIGDAAMPGGVASTDTALTVANHPLTPRHSLWYIGNWPDFELPLAGGFGRTGFTVSGVIFIGLAGLLMFAFAGWKTRLKKISQ